MRIAHTLAAALLLAIDTPAGAGGLSIDYGRDGHHDGYIGHSYGHSGARLGYGHFFHPPVFVAPPHFHDHRFFPRFRYHDRRFPAPGHGQHGGFFPRFDRHERHLRPHGHGHFPRFERHHSFGPHGGGRPSTVTPPPFQGRGFGGP